MIINVFFGVHVRQINFINKNSERINKKDKILANSLNYDNIDFPFSKKDYCKIEKQNTFALLFVVMIIYPIHISNKKFSDSMDLLLVSKKNKSYYVYIKIF